MHARNEYSLITNNTLPSYNATNKNKSRNTYNLIAELVKTLQVGIRSLLYTLFSLIFIMLGSYDLYYYLDINTHEYFKSIQIIKQSKLNYVYDSGSNYLPTLFIRK